MDLSSIESAVLQLVTIIVLALIGIAVSYVKKYLQAHIEDKELLKSIDTTVDVITDSVGHSVQLLSAETEKALADGKLSQEELKDIQDRAYEDYKQHVAPQLQDRLEAHVGDAKAYVQRKAAAYVQKLDKVTN